MKYILLILFTFLYSYCFTQGKAYLDKNHEYHYKAIYIDSTGDTLTLEKMVLEPLGRPWFVQPFKQKAIRYHYYTDTLGIKGYFDPREKHKHPNNEGNRGIKLDSNETTGIQINNDGFYMHPPRRNQYKMLFYVPHPQIKRKCLVDHNCEFKVIMVVPTWGRLRSLFEVMPQEDTCINGRDVNVWRVHCRGKWSFKDPNKNGKIYNSVFNGLFSDEYGYIRMKYEFENGIIIQFDLEKIVEE